MSRTKKMFGAVLAAGIILIFTSCGGGGGGGGSTCQFDSQDLVNACQTIQSNVTAASLIFVGTIKQLGTTPGTWSGVSMEGQIVTYTVGEILRDTNSVATTGSDINIMHLVLDENRQTTSSAALNETLFAVGNQIIVLALRSTALVNIGSTVWDEYATHTDIDGEFSAIPNTTNNLATIRAMISSAGAMIVKKEDGYKRNSSGKTFDLEGSAEDITAWNTLINKCKAALPQPNEFTALWDLVNNSDTEVTFNLGRNQERVLVDSFDGKKVDLTDLEAWDAKTNPLGCVTQTGLCQVLAHVLMEYYYAAHYGKGYKESHEAALLKENDIREEIPKGTYQSGHTGLKRDGKRYVVTVYDGHRELVEKTDGTNPGIGAFTTEPVP